MFLSQGWISRWWSTQVGVVTEIDVVLKRIDRDLHLRYYEIEVVLGIDMKTITWFCMTNEYAEAFRMNYKTNAE